MGQNGGKQRSTGRPWGAKDSPNNDSPVTEMKRVNPKSLKNLKPFEPGINGNPKGRPHLKNNQIFKAHGRRSFIGQS
jgi:hypothetical protein